MATALPSIAPKRHRATWRKHRRHLQTVKCESMLWAVPRVADEAHCLYEFMQRNGRTVEEMVALIAVSDSEYRQLVLWAESRPAIAARLDDMMKFRDDVLRAFRVLVELHELETSACSS